MTESNRFEQWAAELDELAAVLADWVMARVRCLWETTFGEPPEWTGEDDPDRELATRLCMGCLVRLECLEFELRIGAAQTVGVWGALNADDRRALHKVWSVRRHGDIPPPLDDQGRRPAMNGGELFLGGMAAFALLAVTVKAHTGARRARAAADIVRVGTSAVSLVGRVPITALVIVGVQWLVITHPSNPTLLCVVFGLPALLASYTFTKALTVFEIRPSSRGRSDRR